MRSLGARDVLDRLREDFTKNGETYDVVFDAVGKHSFRRSRRSLKPGGIYVSMDVGFMYHVPLLASRHTIRRQQAGDDSVSAAIARRTCSSSRSSSRRASTGP